MLKTVREILSLLTPSNFEEQLARMKTLVIDSEDQLATVTDLFFEKVSIAFNCSSTTHIYLAFIFRNATCQIDPLTENQWWQRGKEKTSNSCETNPLAYGTPSAKCSD
jgi:hypothetical protein